MDPARPRAEAMAVRGEHVVAIGSMKDVQPFISSGTRVIDAGGRLVIPGFNDSHAHFSGGAAGLRQLNLYGVSTLAEVQRLVAERVKTAKPGEWITGNRYDHTLWGTAWPTKEDLDKVAPNNPVRLTRASGHSSWVNSMALRLNNVTKDTPNPDAGEVQKDARTGEPTGIMLETAQGLIRVNTSAGTPDEQRQRQRDDAIAGMRFAATLGVTSLQSSSSVSELEMMRQLAKDSLLTVRFTGWLPLGQARHLQRREFAPARATTGSASASSRGSSTAHSATAPRRCSSLSLTGPISSACRG